MGRGAIHMDFFIISLSVLYRTKLLSVEILHLGPVIECSPCVWQRHPSMNAHLISPHTDYYGNVQFMYFRAKFVKAKTSKLSFFIPFVP